MRSRISEWLIIISIILLILILGALVVEQQNYSIQPDRKQSIEFSGADRQYLSEHHSIRIYVEKDLQYLIGDEKGGYLQDYLVKVLKPAGLRPKFVTDKRQDADCRLVVVTSRTRENLGDSKYIAPLFQVEGCLFIKNRTELKDPLKIALVQDRISLRKQDRLSYHGMKLSCETARSVESAVTAAEKNKAVGIIGDSGCVSKALQEKGLIHQYTKTEKSLYTCNGCILLDPDHIYLYNILNQCIQGADRHNISYEARAAWLDGVGPVYMERSNRTAYLPVLIMILAVLIAFFVYYLTNKNMYLELNTRMDQITASRNEMQTTFHGVGHYLAELTPTGVITEMNQAFIEYAGIGVTGRKIWDVLDLSEEGKQRIRRMVESGAAGDQEERTEEEAGNRIFVIDIFPVENARGYVEQLLFMAIDVTQERMTKLQMLQDNKMIAIGQLAAGVAHEIRNPLGIIRNYCYVLKTMDDEELRAKAIAAIEEAVETSGGIINNLLDFSRVSSGLEEEIDVGKHVSGLMGLNESAFKTKNVQLDIICNAPIRTYIVKESFDMILINLMNNALDAMAEKAEAEKEEAERAGDVDKEIAPGILTIVLTATKKDFFMTVSDTGIGIPPENLEEIYNPFFTTKGSMGTGLGLYIVYNEVEKLGGEIDVTSRVGLGTTFRIRLPIRHKAETDKNNNRQ